jgi:hypothetical protein
MSSKEEILKQKAIETDKQADELITSIEMSWVVINDHCPAGRHRD